MESVVKNFYCFCMDLFSPMTSVFTKLVSHDSSEHQFSRYKSKALPGLYICCFFATAAI